MSTKKKIGFIEWYISSLSQPSKVVSYLPIKKKCKGKRKGMK